MKKSIRNLVIEAIFVFGVYCFLLHRLAGTNIVAGIFCPGPHLPPYYPVLISLIMICRIYLILLPGLVLSRLGLAWLRSRDAREAS